MSAKEDLKEVGQKLDDAAKSTGHAVEHAAETVTSHHNPAHVVERTTVTGETVQTDGRIPLSHEPVNPATGAPTPVVENGPTRS